VLKWIFDAEMEEHSSPAKIQIENWPVLTGSACPTSIFRYVLFDGELSTGVVAWCQEEFPSRRQPGDNFTPGSGFAYFAARIYF
jgi:hypothetical protein